VEKRHAGLRAKIDQTGTVISMGRIRSFLYRFPRFTADCRMDFIHGDRVVLGSCSNLSESGLRGTFATDVPAGAEGLLTLYHNERQFEVKAKIDAVQDEETLVHFVFRSDKERAAISELVERIRLAKL